MQMRKLEKEGMEARKKGKRELVVCICVCQQRRDISLYVCFIFFSYGRKQFPREALNAGADLGKPLSQPGAASACCCGIVNNTVTTTTPSNANAATIAITPNDVILLFILSSSILFYLGLKHFPLLLSKDLLTAGPLSHPASASCSGIVTANVITTTPSTPSAATMAIMAIDIVFSSFEW